MVEISTEQSMLITVVTFLSIFGILVMMIPGDLFAYSTEKRIINVPEYFESVDITYYADVENFTIGSSDYQRYFSLGGHYFAWETNVYHKCLVLWTHGGWWIFRWDFNSFKWYDNVGIERSVYIGIPDSNVIPGYWYALPWSEIEASESWTLQQIGGQEVSVSLFWGYNKTKYSSPYDAFLHDELHVLIAIGFDKVNTSINAWSLIGNMLFFQAPDIHPAINAIIAIPIWVAVAYLIYILILKAIPFVGD